MAFPPDSRALGLGALERTKITSDEYQKIEDLRFERKTRAALRFISDKHKKVGG